MTNWRPYATLLTLSFLALLPATARAQAEEKPHYGWALLPRVETLFAVRAQLGDATPFMLGAGVSGRKRITPRWGLDVALDFWRGVDANGYHRDEVPIAASVVFYPSYRDYNQIYFLGGIGYAHASVFSEQERAHLAHGTTDSYDYLGLHVGLGFEFLFNEGTGLTLDALAFARGRIDSGLHRYPEFFDETDRSASNWSTGCVVRSGLVLWW
jgi:hypothetical protein